MTTIPASSTAPGTAAPGTAAPGTAAPGAAAPQVAQQTFGIMSLVIAIVSIVTGFVPIGSAVAIVLGAIALQREPASRKIATAGIIIGAVPLAIGTLLLALVPFGAIAAASWGIFGFWF